MNAQMQKYSLLGPGLALDKRWLTVNLSQLGVWSRRPPATLSVDDFNQHR